MNIAFKLQQKVRKLYLSVFAALFILLPQASAQKGWELGVWLGASYYFGDLNTNFDLGMPGPAGGLIIRHNFNDRVCLKLSGNYAQVQGDDARSNNVFERTRNLSFRSSILDAALQLEFNFLPYKHGSKDQFYTPYLFGGFNVFSFNPTAEYQGERVDLRPLGTEGQFKGEEYYGFSGGLLLGGGFKIDLSYEWSLNFEFSGRHTFTDYLDDVSKTYPDKDDLLRQRGELAVALSDRSLPTNIDNSQVGLPGTQRGDSKTKDVYVTLGIGLLYYFGDVRCPDYGRRRRR